MPKRTNGIPVIKHIGYDVVPADAVALLSGVNFSTVAKVLTALDAIKDFSKVDPAKLIDASALPTEHAFSANASMLRSGNTAIFCRDLAGSGKYLNHDGRPYDVNRLGDKAYR